MHKHHRCISTTQQTFIRSPWPPKGYRTPMDSSRQDESAGIIGLARKSKLRLQEFAKNSQKRRERDIWWCLHTGVYGSTLILSGTLAPRRSIKEVPAILVRLLQGAKEKYQQSLIKWLCCWVIYFLEGSSQHCTPENKGEDVFCPTKYCEEVFPYCKSCVLSNLFVLENK